MAHASPEVLRCTSSIRHWRHTTMSNVPEGLFAEASAQHIAPLAPTMEYPPAYRRGLFHAAITVSLLCSGVAAAEDNSPAQLRRFIDQQVGGIQKLMVPADNDDIPQPRLANGSPDPLFQTTEAKRYLGKLLFHEPARATRIIPEFGGILATAEPRPAEPVISARRRRRPARSSTSPQARRGEATRTPRGTSLRAGGRLRTCRFCGRTRSSRATRWWTTCPR